MTVQRPYRFIVSGGGTGGHIFPALAIADQLKVIYADAEILFVGAEGKMEMQKVPEAGYKILGLPIAGIQRSLSLKNLVFPFKLLNSLNQANKIVKNFRPDAVIGVGGYASGPILRAASNAGIPCLLQEQNSYAGLTNKWLKNKVKKICVAYEGMDKYFPMSKLHLTGNPIRKKFLSLPSKEEAYRNLRLRRGRPTIFVMGGSLGARTLNESVFQYLESIEKLEVNVIWQCGKFYENEFIVRLEHKLTDFIKLKPFIEEMEMAYAAADIIISRAGALSVSELAVVGKPVIFVPSPNVAEDHQTKNAQSFVMNEAALLVKDSEAIEDLMPTAFNLLKNEGQQQMLKANIKAMAKPQATEDIVNHIISIIA
jgi:UDP-N-acetylglucosamine--N-acetylmuramyl-(pentapeptide) pyrophosphoryl-undecaprenol N-acetylglucosamine transferase